MVNSYKIANALTELNKVTDFLGDLEYDYQTLRQDKQKRREIARDIVREIKKQWNNSCKAKNKLDDGKWVITIEERDALIDRILDLSVEDVT
jgi:hypothetical protein